MTDLGQGLIGQWGVYAGPIYSELDLGGDGSYRHTAFGGARAHWGVWDVENQNGQQWLVLHLEGADPMFEPTPMGWQPIQWPSYEAFALTGIQDGEVDFNGGAMRRLTSASDGPPPMAYPGAPPGLFTPPDTEAPDMGAPDMAAAPPAPMPPGAAAPPVAAPAPPAAPPVAPHLGPVPPAPPMASPPLRPPIPILTTIPPMGASAIHSDGAAPPPIHPSVAAPAAPGHPAATLPPSPLRFMTPGVMPAPAVHPTAPAATASAAVHPAAPPAPACVPMPPPSVLQQWQGAHDSTNQVQSILAQMQRDDQRTNMKIAQMQQAEQQQEFEATQQVHDNWERTFDKANDAFDRYIKE
jgi:hypothetical protein